MEQMRLLNALHVLEMGSIDVCDSTFISMKLLVPLMWGFRCSAQQLYIDHTTTNLYFNAIS